MRYMLIVLLAGCTTTLRHAAMDYNNPPPADWPKLREHIYSIQHADLARYCKTSAENAAKSVSCAVINFAVNTCSIYITEKALPDSLQHEREHCLGYNHVGDLNRSRNAWERWKATQR